MTLSVITVCYNEENSIESTMKSVLAQSFTDFEYIIKDGGSTDRTVKKALAFRDRFRKRGIELKVISGTDQGLYDAMNIGVREARGEWVSFLNAGDLYFDWDTLRQVFEGKDYGDAELLYGDAAEKEFGEYYYFRKCPEAILSRMPFSHQSVFVRRSLQLKFPFELKYRIGADYHFLLRCYLSDCIFRDTGVLVAIVSKDGVSSVRLKDTYLETVRIRRSLGVFSPKDELTWKKRISLSLRQLGMDYLPKSAKYWIRKYQRKVRGQKAVGARPKVGRDHDLLSGLYRKWIYPFIRMRLAKRTKSILRAGSYVKNAKLCGRNYLGLRTIFRDGTLGFGSYINRDGDFTGAEIGKYCSIGSEVSTAIGSHPTDTQICMHPAFTNPAPVFGFSYAGEKTFDDSVKGIKIGNDVWLGDRVTILDGVEIGDGAVVGTGAVVTKNLPPYSVNVGVPARTIRYRFEKDEIERLLKSRWWDRDEKWIRKHIRFFRDPKAFLTLPLQRDRRQ